MVLLAEGMPSGVQQVRNVHQSRRIAATELASCMHLEGLAGDFNLEVTSAELVCHALGLDESPGWCTEGEC